MADDDVDGGSGGNLKLLLNPHHHHHHSSHITPVFSKHRKALVVICGFFLSMCEGWTMDVPCHYGRRMKRWNGDGTGFSCPCLNLWSARQRAICHLRFFLMRFMLTQTAQIYLLIGKIRKHNRVNETSVSAAFYPSLFLSPLHPCLACFNQQKHNYHLGFIALTENIRKCWQRVCQCELRSVQIEEILFWHHGSVLYNVSPCEVLFTASENKMQREVSCTLELEPTKTQIT